MALTGLLAGLAGGGAQPGTTPAAPAAPSPLKGLLGNLAQERGTVPVSAAPPPKAPAAPAPQTPDHKMPGIGSFISDTFNALPDAAKAVSGAINDFLINKPATALASTKPFQALEAGVQQNEKNTGVDTGSTILGGFSSLGSGIISGLTQGAFTPETAAPDNLATHVVSALGNGLATAASIGAISKGLKLLEAPAAIQDFLASNPLFTKYALPVLRNGIAFSAVGQLNPALGGDVGKRLETLGTDFATAVPYTALGFLSGVKGAAVSIPASFGLGYGLARMAGASNQDALISGFTVGALDAMGRVGSEGQSFITGRQADTNLRQAAVETLNKYGDGSLTMKSSDDDIKAAYRAGAKATHPDLGGNTKDFIAVQSAYDYLTGKGNTLATSDTNSVKKQALGISDGSTGTYDHTGQEAQVATANGEPEVPKPSTGVVLPTYATVASNDGNEPAAEPGSSADVRAHNVQEAVTRLQAGHTPTEVIYAMAQHVPQAEAQQIVAEAQQQVKPAAPEATPTQVPTELPPVSESTLNKTPNEFQQDFASVQVAHEDNVSKLESAVKDLETKVAAAPAQSAEKKNLKVQLSQAKEAVTQAGQGHDQSISTHAGALSSLLQGHLQNQHGVSKEAAPEAAGKVIAHVTEPNLVAKHGDTSLREIAANVAGEHHTAQISSLKEGETVRVRGKSGQLRKEGTVVSTSKEGVSVKDKEGNVQDFPHKSFNFEHVGAKKTQTETVKEAVAKKGTAKAGDIAKETKILEPNVRRILGLGAKKGEFERVDDGVYRIKTADGKDAAFIIPGDAMKVLPKLAAEGFKADMVFLDIPYKTKALVGGNRGIKDFTFISPAEFNHVLMNINKIVSGDESSVFYMFSQAKSGEKEMAAYTDLFSHYGFKPVARGDWTKLFQNGKLATNPRGEPAAPEGIILFNKTGKMPEGKAAPSLAFKLIRPKGYQTEKPAEMLKALIEMSTKEGETVLDPFAGSGVTAEQAVKSGRKAVAIEKNPEQARKVAERVKKAADEGYVKGEKRPDIIASMPESKKVELVGRLEELSESKRNMQPTTAKYKAAIDEIEDIKDELGLGRGGNSGGFGVVNGKAIRSELGLPDSSFSALEDKVREGRGETFIEKADEAGTPQKPSYLGIVKANDYAVPYHVITAGGYNASRNFDTYKEAVAFAKTLTGYDGEFDLAKESETKITVPSTPQEAADAYWKAKIAPAIKAGKAVVIGADDLKDYFNNDYELTRHPIYSGAANQIFERAVQEVENPLVKFTIGGTGSGKSDFVVAHQAEDFDGIIYDSTGYKYEGGLKNQIEFAENHGKDVKLYGIIPDITRARAYTFDRELRGEHPVTETAFIRTHSGAIDTMKKAIADGIKTYVMDSRGVILDKDELSNNPEFELNPVAKLEGLGYSEDNVKNAITGITKENAREIIARSPENGAAEQVGTERTQDLSKESGTGEEVDRSALPEKPQAEKVPRAPKPKSEETAVTKEEPKQGLDPRELYNAELAIAQNRPRGYAATVFKEVATWFNPRGQAQTPAVDVIMKNKGEYERILFRTERATREIKKMWDKVSQTVALDFMDKVETGDTASLPPEFKKLADMYRTRLDNAHAAISEFKDVPFLENYFPHLWKDPEAVAKANIWAKANAKRPFQGNKSFTKQRIFSTIQDGIKAGFELETHNPEELMQLHEQNIQKFLMANRILDDLKARGFAKLVQSGGKSKIPDGFSRINDSIAKVYLNPNIPILEAYDQKVYDALADVVQNLGLEHDRKYEIGQHGALGFTQKGTDKITTKFGTPLSVIAHELGHQLDYKFDLKDLFKSDPDRTYGSDSDYTQKELRKLADLRYEGQDVTDSYKQYIRSASEKMAVMLEAYVHAPEAFKEAAPRTFEKFTAFLALHDETRPILDIKPSLVMGTREDTIYAGGMILGGEYHVQQDVARMINNFLSPDHIMDTALGKGIMVVKNTMNAFELGFSAFHLTMETFDTMITKFGIGLTKVVSGDFNGFKDMLVSPAAPLTYFRAGQKFYNGDPELLQIEHDLFTGGASLREKQYYKNTMLDTFMAQNRAILGMIKNQHFDTTTATIPDAVLKPTPGYKRAPTIVKAIAANLLRLPLATVEATMRPLFTYYIPRLKVGAFRDLFASELQRNSQRIQNGEMTRASIARDVWNNIENRMGELNYDNLFWNRNLKTGLMLTTRAVGWNLGTVRELGGGFFQDLPAEAIKAAKGKGFNFTPKMAYTFSLFFFVGTVGAIYQYLHTGKLPQSAKDLFYPENGATTASGEPYRVDFPTYLKDIYQSGVPQLLTGNPFGAFDSFTSMLKNKSSPELSTILDLMNNQDFYGNEIRNPHDNTPTQLKQVALYLLTQLVPFTLQQQQNLAAGKSDVEQQAESFLGIVKAPAAVIQSDYNAQLQAIYSDQVGGFAPETPEQAAQAAEKAQVVAQIKKGDYSGVQKLINDGIIKPTGLKQFLQGAVLTTPQKEYRGLSPENKAKVNSLK